MTEGTPLHGYATEGAKEAHYVAVPAADRMALCGMGPLAWIPLVPQPTPEAWHWQCVVLARTTPPAVAEAPEEDGPAEGRCPECQERHALDADGRLVPHTVARTKTPYAPCAGGGQAPEVTA